jgi:hypothetical protein
MYDDCFRDMQQRVDVCRALLALGVDLKGLWTNEGPTDKARALGEDSSHLSAGDRALLLAAFAFWSGHAVPLRVDELIGLDEAEPICKLLTATIYGHKAVDAWLTRSDSLEGFVSSRADVHDAAARLYDEARAVFAEGGEHPINFTAAPDACALGALRMAEHALMQGVSRVRKERKVTQAAIEMTVHVLGLYAAIERDRAEAEDKRDSLGDDEAEDGSLTDTVGPRC